MPRASGDGSARKPTGAVASGDRAVFLGLGPRGAHCDVLAVRGQFATIRIDGQRPALALISDCHPIPRRPLPMW
jgi:hypothetical protein